MILAILAHDWVYVAGGVVAIAVGAWAAVHLHRKDTSEARR